MIKVEKCPADPNEFDVFEIDSEGIDTLMYCGNRDVNKSDKK